MNSKELREKRAKAIADSRAIMEKAEGESRELSAEENSHFDTLFAQADGFKGQIERIERLEVEERELATSQGTIAGQGDSDPSDPPTAGDPPSGGAQTRSMPLSPEVELRLKAWRGLLRNGYSKLPEVEQRALQADSDEAGGFTVAPEMFVTQLIQAVDDMVFIRPLATKHTIAKAASLGAPSLDADPSDADWTSEILTGSLDTTMDFGKRDLTPHPLAKRLKVSNKLIRTSGIDIVALVRERLAYKFAITQEKGFLTGTGSNQPLGLFTASALGISTGRDVSTGNSSTAIAFDGLINAKLSLKGNYWARAQWIFHRDAIKELLKLKDGEGQYIWRESVRVSEPDRLLGLPVMMSEYAPNTFTTGLYVGIVGDFSHYWIVDALDMQIQVLDQLYAETNQIGYIARLETDGMPVLEEAFARVKLA